MKEPTPRENVVYDEALQGRIDDLYEQSDRAVLATMNKIFHLFFEEGNDE